MGTKLQWFSSKKKHFSNACTISIQALYQINTSLEVAFFQGLLYVELCPMTDILLDNTGDLETQDGDFVFGFSDSMHQEHILIATKGEYKEFPELGVGLNKMLSDDDYVSFLIDAKKNLEYDGMRINNIKFEENGNLNIDGYYK